MVLSCKRRKPSKGNSSGYRGVSKVRNKYFSEIKHNGVKELGPCRDTAKQAAEDHLKREMQIRGAVRLCNDCEIEYNDPAESTDQGNATWRCPNCSRSSKKICAKRPLYRENSSGYRCVKKVICKNTTMYRSQIWINGVLEYGPRRDTAKQAAEDYLKREMQIRGAVRLCDDCEIEYNDPAETTDQCSSTWRCPNCKIEEEEEKMATVKVEDKVEVKIEDDTDDEAEIVTVKVEDDTDNEADNEADTG